MNKNIIAPVVLGAFIFLALASKGAKVEK